MNRPKISAHESMLIPGAAYRFSLAEITVWGHLFYAVEVQDEHEVQPGSAEKVVGIHSNAIVGYLLVFLAHATSVLKMLGYDGPRILRAQMRSTPWVPPL